MTSKAIYTAVLLVISTLSLLSLANSAPGRAGSTSKMMEEIASYQDVVDQIVDYALNGPGENQSYNRLAEFTDAFGNRLSGMRKNG